MLVKDIRYIIKRIIIGVGIALLLMLIKGNFLLSVNARTISSYGIGGTVAVVDNTSSGYSVNVSGSPWAGYGDGYLYVNFSLYKVNGASTSPTVAVRTVKVFVGSASYTCNYGSSTSNNSTFVSSSYSAVCPVHIDSNGISSIWVGLQDNQQNSISQYRLTFDSNITFEQKPLENDYNSVLGSINANANANAGYTQNAINNASNSITSNQNQNTQDIINNQNQNSQALQNTLNDTSTTQADSDASDFFGNFSSNSHGLSGIISAPLRLIQSISSSTCSALTVPLPFVDQNVSLPCMSTIYTTHFNTFLVLYRLITTGLIGYWVCVRLFSKVKDFQNPDNDRIEVLDL